MSDDTTKPDQYDPARLLTVSALLFVGMLIGFVCFIIGLQIWNKGEANTESWAALTGVIGWATGQLGAVFNARYGTTQQSANKDETIKVLSQTASVATDTAQASQAAAAGAANPGQPVKVDAMSVDAAGASISIEKGNP